MSTHKQTPGLGTMPAITSVPRTFFGSEPIAYAYVGDDFIDVIHGQSSAVVTGINDSGQVAGYYNTPIETRRVLWQPRQCT